MFSSRNHVYAEHISIPAGDVKELILHPMRLEEGRIFHRLKYICDS